jgi:hypothetical protein
MTERCHDFDALCGAMSFTEVPWLVRYRSGSASC